MNPQGDTAAQKISAPADVNSQALDAQILDMSILRPIVRTRAESHLKLNLSFCTYNLPQKFVIWQHVMPFELF